MYIFVYICICKDSYVFTYTYIHVFMLPEMYIYIYINAQLIFIYTYRNIYTCIYTYIPTHKEHVRIHQAHTNTNTSCQLPSPPHTLSVSLTKCQSLLPACRPVHTIHVCTHVGNTARNHPVLRRPHAHTHTHISEPLGSTIALAKHTAPHNVPDQACSQRQGMRAAALTPPQARLGSLRHDAAAACGPVHEKTRSDVSTPHTQVVKCEFVYLDATQNIRVF